MPLLDIHAGPSYGTIDRMDNHGEEGERLLQAGYESEGNGSTITSSEDSVQEGVRKIEAINLTWTTKSLVVAYIRFVDAMGIGLGCHDAC